MPPAPLPLLSCSCPCSPPPPQGRWPVCAERGTCAPSLPHFPTSPRSFFFPFSFAPPPIRDSVLPRSPPCNTPLHSSAHSSPPFFLLLLSFIPPPIRVPVFPRSPPCDTPLIRSSISTSPLLCSCVPPRPLFFFFHLSFVPPPIRVPVFPRSPPCNTPLHSSAHSSPPLFSSSPFLRPSAHSEPRYPAFPAVRHSTHPLLHLHFPAPPPIRVPIPAFPAVRHSHPLLRSFIPPFFLLPLSFAPPPIRVPFSRVPRRATFPSAPLRQVLTGNREKSRQPHRRSSRTKKSGPLGPDTIGYQSVFQKKGRLHLAHTNALTQHNQSGAYPLINPCSHN